MQTILALPPLQSSYVSLSVAIIALIGVLISTFCNNKCADSRRRSDQEGADKRRRLDQEKEDARRREEEKKRVEESRRELIRGDCGRQRSAVANCIKSIRIAERDADLPVRDNILSGDAKALQDNDYLHLVRAFKREDFYTDCIIAVQGLQLEITNKTVRRYSNKLEEQLLHECNRLTALRASDKGRWLSEFGNDVVLGAEMQKCINELRSSAYENLHKPD